MLIFEIVNEHNKLGGNASQAQHHIKIAALATSNFERVKLPLLTNYNNSSPPSIYLHKTIQPSTQMDTRFSASILYMNAYAEQRATTTTKSSIQSPSRMVLRMGVSCHLSVRGVRLFGGREISAQCRAHCTCVKRPLPFYKCM